MKSKNKCPLCGGRTWATGATGVELQTEMMAYSHGLFPPVVDEYYLVYYLASACWVDFCTRCGCGVTSHQCAARPDAPDAGTVVRR